MKKLILFLSTLLFLSFLKAEDRVDLVKDPSFNYYKAYVSNSLIPYWYEKYKDIKSKELTDEYCQTSVSFATSMELGRVLDRLEWEREEDSRNLSYEDVYNFFNYLSSYFYDQVKVESKQAVIISKRQIELKNKLKEKQKVFADQVISNLKEILSVFICKAPLIPKEYKDDSRKFFLEKQDFLKN